MRLKFQSNGNVLTSQLFAYAQVMLEEGGGVLLPLVGQTILQEMWGVAFPLVLRMLLAEIGFTEIQEVNSLPKT